MADNKLIITYLVDASDRIKVFDFSVPAKQLTEVKLPSIATANKFNSKYNDSEVFFSVSSFTDPGSYMHLNMKDFKLETLRKG